MLRRRTTGLRLLVAGLVLLSLGVQPRPVRSATWHASALAASPPVGGALALPSGRGDAQMALQGRERSSVPLVPLGDVAVAPLRPAPRASSAVTPRARSHPARHLRRSADDPPH